MAKNPFSHIDLRVRNFSEALPLYRAFLPLLGFTKFSDYEEWKGFSGENCPLPERAFFGLMLDENHVPNANRIAFWVESPAVVDRVGEAIIAAGAKDVEGPMLCDEYSKDYYAVFFADPSGNRLEVVHRTE